MDTQYAVASDFAIASKTKPVKPPFGYYGAKQRIARQIIELLPPHNAWVEGFCGSAAISLAKPVSPIEVINDADGQIVNLFEQLRDNSEELCRLIALTPYSRDEYQIARLKEQKLDPLEKARRFLVATMMTINGVQGSSISGFSFSNSFVRGSREARVNRWYNLPSRLELIVERLRGMRIENRDACDLVKMFSNRPATLIYLDPPYFVKRRHSYDVDANTLEFHTKFLTLCKEANCMILISGYENDLYNTLLTAEDGWSKNFIETNTRATCGNNLSRTEILWVNNLFRKATETGRVPIELTDNEIKEKKVNPPR